MSFIAEAMKYKKQVRPHMVACEHEICEAIKVYAESGRRDNYHTPLFGPDIKNMALSTGWSHPYSVMQAAIGNAILKLESKTSFTIEAVDITLDPISCNLRIGKWF